MFERLCGALGVPEWKTDPRFVGNRARIQNRVELIKLISEKVATNNRQCWIGTFTAAGVPCAAVNTIPEVLQEPQIAALGILQKVADTGVTLTGLPLSFDGARPQIRKLGPRLGQDNERRLNNRT